MSLHDLRRFLWSLPIHSPNTTGLGVWITEVYSSLKQGRPLPTGDNKYFKTQGLCKNLLRSDPLLLPSHWNVPKVFKTHFSNAFAQRSFCHLFIWSESMTFATGLSIPIVPLGCLSFLIRGFNTDLKDWLAPNTEFIFLSAWFIENTNEGFSVVCAGVPPSALSVDTLCPEHTRVSPRVNIC